MSELIERRLRELKQKPFTELARLPQYQGEKGTDGGKTVIVAVWKDTIDEHRLRIVVQTYRHWFLGIGSMNARGFKIDDNGNISDLATKEIYEFI